MGTPEFAVPTLKALTESEDELAAVISQPDKHRGRGRKLEPTPTKLFAEEHNIPVLQPAKVKTDEFLDELRALRPEVIVVAAYGKILPGALLEIPPHGCINVHPSLLPKYRGASPIRGAVLSGDKITGVTIMQLDEGMDTGDILLQEVMPIEHEDTAETLSPRLSKLGAELIIQTIKLLKEGLLEPKKQDDSLATHTSMLKKEDGLIDWRRSADEIRNLIRGMQPWPGAYTYLGQKMLKIYSSEISHTGGSPGEVLGSSREVLEVACGEGSLLIKELQIEGGKRLDTKSFLAGRNIEPGTILGKAN